MLRIGSTFLLIFSEQVPSTLTKEFDFVAAVA